MSDKTPQGTRKPPASAWRPGQSGNPHGRPAGSRNRATILAQEMIDGRGPELVKAALDLASNGDTAMLKLCIDRLCPPRKDAPVKIHLPPLETAASLPQATEAVLAAVADGELTPSEATSIAGLIEAHRRALETSDLATRIEALEANRSAENGR